MSWIPPYSIAQALATLSETTWDGPHPASVLTRIGLQFWGPTPEGTAALVRHEGLSPTEEDVAACVRFCREREIDPLLCLYNYDGDWNWERARTAFSERREELIGSLIEEVERFQLEGVDLDFEGVEEGPGDREAFALFVRALGEELHRRGKLLTVNLSHTAEGSIPNLSWIVDWGNSVDAARSMGYTELYGGAPSICSYAEQQRYCTEEMGLSSEKFLIGLPGWVSGWGRGGRGSHLLDHLNELLDLPQPTEICIWDAALTGEAWRTPEAWALLSKIQQRKK